jgi:hypothetical protein
MGDDIRAAAGRHDCIESLLTKLALGLMGVEDALQRAYEGGHAAARAERPAGDGEVPDLEWWRSLGAAELFGRDGKPLGDGWLFLTKDMGYDCHFLGVGSPNGIGFAIYTSMEDRRVSIGGFDTRGHVRALLRALNVPPPEAPDA